ncbi:5-hydroxytryptamine receptor 5A-like [Cydia strobilella]|uniref:5-hydroxytryptamine receptor 5A-like n=1 Tax=Cydia strobilella TaxID=1100964 RepID=UPI003007954C
MLDSIFRHVTSRFPLRLRTRLHMAMVHMAWIYQLCPQSCSIRRSRHQGPPGVPSTTEDYVFFSVTFSFYVPTCIMLVQYGLILRALALRPPIRAHRGQCPIVEMDQMKCPESSQQTDEAGAAERQRRVTITIIRLMCHFLICWTPFFVMLPVDSLCDCVQDSTWQWCTWLGYTNSALNPVVYAAAATRVRRAFQALLKMTRHGE